MEKFIHLGDLHLGIRFHKRDLLADQKKILDDVVSIAVREQADVVVAGDVFDTVNPSVSAQEVWFSFLHSLNEFGSRVYVIAGNHDSSARLALGNEFLSEQGIVITSPDDCFRWFNMGKKEDPWALVLVPFISPSIASRLFQETFTSFTEVYQRVIEEIQEDVDDNLPMVLVAHQCFEGSARGESEFIPFMSDSIDTKVVSPFQEVWAGHLHAHQKIGNVTYSGSLLGYAFGDDYLPSISLWTRCKGNWEHSRIDLEVPHPLKEYSGDLNHCLSIEDNNSYVKVKLVGESDLDYALTKLSEHFPYLCCVVNESANDWKVDLDKPIGNFSSFEETVDSFCDHLEIPRFQGRKSELMEEAVNAYKNAED